MKNETAIVAFSGGLDTSFLVPFSRDKYGFKKIITVTVNTGGFDADDEARIAARSKEVGADEHLFLDGREEFYQSIIKFLIFGNVTRDGYPLSVGAERLVQGKKVLEICREKGASAVLHGSTGAGNDQYRFDLVAYVLGGKGIKSYAPVREFNFSREYTSGYLRERNVDVPEKSTSYSYNVGLWGVSIGGKETHSSTGRIPEEAWYSKNDPEVKPLTISLEFTKGELSGLKNGGTSISNPVEIIAELARLGSRYGIGRHYHVGTSIPGKKGRLAYESPAADIIYEAHRTLEKITLTQAQIQAKRFLSDEFGRLIHEAKFFDPYLEDLKAFLSSSQRRATGTCNVELLPGRVGAVTADSPYNLLAAKGAVYGEVSDYYDGRDAEGACKLNAFEQYLYRSFND